MEKRPEKIGFCAFMVLFELVQKVGDIIALGFALHGALRRKLDNFVAKGIIAHFALVDHEHRPDNTESSAEERLNRHHSGNFSTPEYVDKESLEDIFAVMSEGDFVRVDFFCGFEYCFAS